MKTDQLTVTVPYDQFEKMKEKVNKIIMSEDEKKAYEDKINYLVKFILAPNKDEFKITFGQSSRGRIIYFANSMGSRSIQTTIQ